MEKSVLAFSVNYINDVYFKNKIKKNIWDDIGTKNTKDELETQNKL